MSVTVLANKTVGFRSPYIGDTFQDLTQKILGRDGYLSGGKVSDDGANITIPPIVFVQRGIVVETEVAAPLLPVPVLPEPWFLVAAVPDDDPVTGVIFSVTRDLISATNGTVVAYKTGGVWQNPVSVDVIGAFSKASEAGVESGAQPFFTLDGSDNMNEMILNRGRVVDPDGIRRSLPREAGSSAKSLGFTPVRAHPTKGRQDYIVLRQRESFTSEVSHLIGGLFDDGSYGGVSKTGTRLSYFGRRGGSVGEQWFAYGSGANLRIQGGPTGESFAELTLLVGAGSIGETWIAGQRESDSAVILLYTDSGDVRMVSFNGTTGAQIDAPVTIDTQGNTCRHVRGEIDSSELLHVVYEHDEGGGPPSQQAYYTRRTIATASFASAAITPRIVTGAATGRNDTWPDVSVDRQGNAHIVYTSGLLSDEFGELAYAVIGQAGNLEVNQLELVAAAVGKQADPDDKIGFVATAFNNIRKARVEVTPFDEVYAVMLGDETGTVDQVLMFSPGFSERLGFPIVNVGTGVTGLYGADLVSNDQGELRLATGEFAAGFHTIREIGLDTEFASDGLLAKTLLRTVVVSGPTASAPQGIGTDEEDLAVRMGTIGDVRLSHRLDNTGLTSVIEVGTVDDSGLVNTSKPHPKDLYLSAFEVPDDVSGDIPEEEIRLFNVRPKKMNYPFLVGIDGEFQGFLSVYDAVRSANAKGGEIVVRKGDYRNLSTGVAPNALQLASGVTLRGEGQVLFDGYQFRIGASTSYAIGNIDGDIVEIVSAVGNVIRPGDVVELTGGGASGFHRVLANLPPKGSHASRYLLDASAPLGAVPAGTTLVPYPAGNKIENVAIRGSFSTERFFVLQSYQAVLRDISLFGTYLGVGGPMVLIDGAHHALLDNLDFSKLAASKDTAISLVSSFMPHVRDCRSTFGFADILEVDTLTDTPSISSCAGLEVQAASPRTTPVLISGADDGRVDGLGTSTDGFTTMGNLLKSISTIHLQDENTRAGPADNVAFSGNAVDGDKLPSGRGSALAAADLLTALHIAEHNQRSQFGAGMLSGGTPSLGAFPQVDTSAASYFAWGIQVDAGAVLESSATVADTVYYWHLTAAGTLTRSTTADLDDTSKTVVVKAKTNPGNTAFIEFVDMRRFISKPDAKGPIVVGPGVSPADVDNLHFFTLQGALHWLELNPDLDVADIVITGLLDMTNGEDPLELNFQSTGLRSLVIRGLGEDAGIKWGQDEDLFRATGLASKNAVGGDGQKATLRLHNLLFDNTNAAGPTDGKALLLLSSGYFTDVVVDECRTMVATQSWDHFVRNQADQIDNCTVAQNEIEDARGVDTLLRGVLTFSEANKTVRNLHIFRNTFRNSTAVTANTRGIAVSDDVQNLWISDNSFEPGRDVGSGHQVYAVAIECENADSSNAPDVGCRYIVNNSIVHTEFDNADADIAIKVTGVGDMPFFVLHNQIIGNYNGCIDAAPILAHGSVVQGNVVQTSTQADNVGIKVLAEYCLIADNHVEIPTSGISSLGIQFDGDYSTCARNTLDGTAQSGIEPRGNYAKVVSNILTGGWLNAAIRVTGSTNTHAVDNQISGSAFNGIIVTSVEVVVRGNSIETAGPGIVILAAGDRCLVSGNKVDTTAGTSPAFEVAGFQCVCTGNDFVQEDTSDSDSAVAVIDGPNCVFTGNLVKARIDADYGNNGPGRSALRVESGTGHVITGNFFYNRGTHSTKATIEILAASDNGTFVGNTLRNESGAPTYFSNAGSGWEFGTSGGSSPGSNKQTI